MECYNLPIAPRPRSSKESTRSAPPSQVSSIRVGKSVVEHDICRDTERLSRNPCRRRPPYAARLGRHRAASWDSSARRGASRESPPPSMIQKVRGVQWRVHLPTSSCSIGRSSFGVRPSHLSHNLIENKKKNKRRRDK